MKSGQNTIHGSSSRDCGHFGRCAVHLAVRRQFLKGAIGITVGRPRSIRVGPYPMSRDNETGNCDWVES
ncbi:MAG: hypothetical protein ACJASX_002286 [Limisphaerales bacterium]|jgi:hypothetical protein